MLYIQVLIPGRGYTFSADIWSLGCAIMFVCNRGQHLFQVETQDLVHGMARKMAGWKGLLQSGFDGQLDDLIKTMLHPDHHQRPTAQKIGIKSFRGFYSSKKSEAARKVLKDDKNWSGGHKSDLLDCMIFPCRIYTFVILGSRPMHRVCDATSW